MNISNQELLKILAQRIKTKQISYIKSFLIEGNFQDDLQPISTIVELETGKINKPKWTNH
jgi:hypothetical protein